MRASFATETSGLRRDIPPMRLFEKAKRLGVWNPSEIDLARDRADWLALSSQQQDLILRLTSLFQAGTPGLVREFDKTMNALLPLALGGIDGMFAAYDGNAPFGLKEDDFVEYALGQYAKRFERIETARGRTSEEIYRMAQAALDSEE